MTEQRIGIIDIGSNSVRLVIYERTANGAHRVIDGSKRPARLSERIDDNGNLTKEALRELLGTLNHFRLICAHNRVGHIRAVATAAIRNAANRDEVLETIESESGIAIELLSGEDEANYGFLGMINAMDVQDGFLVDIGGGSTEVSLFQGREFVQSFSFPFGCVNLHRKFAAKGGMLTDEGLQALESYVAEAVAAVPWLVKHPSLPLIGVGGTARALGKVHQAAVKYPFTQTHNYPMTGVAVDELFNELYRTPLDKRRKFPGLSKDRVDVIVPGLAVMRLLYRTIKASHYRICGSGLRDGLFHDTRFPGRPKHQNPLAFSVHNLSALHPAVPQQHVMQVNRLALQLFDELHPSHLLAGRERILLDTASSLFRIGGSIDYYEYAKHTFYLIVNSHLNGLSHREILMIGAIASYKSKNRVRQQLNDYKELLNETDFDAVYKLGTLLQLAAALDRSETQAIGRLEIEYAPGGQLLLRPVRFSGSLTLESQEVDELSSDFKKLWGVTPLLDEMDYT
ncbi:Ppx/GppA family phosphatase [Paenibacillus sp. NPDC058174]|uniref:Ppx/GppA phosphatase family protein n=1 Tax=Paenibacillus sp. NPDC058174 TaxID=3346366 RepID=UPI0036D7AED2